MMVAPDVSVIIPTFNRAGLVRDAINSALRQRVPGELTVEVIIVDDASTDETSAVLESYGQEIRAVREDSNRGQCVARNRGLDLATGRYVKFLDSDDVLCDDSLFDEVSLADETGADIVVCGWIESEIDSNGHEIEGSRETYPAPVMDPMPDAVLWGRAVPTGAALYCTEGIGGLRWDVTIGKLADWDWFCMAALQSHRIVARDEAAYVMRGHGGARLTSSSSMLVNAQCHHRVLRKLETWLSAHDELNDVRQHRLAQYFYKELRVLSLYDRASFDAGVRKIRELDPRFVPRDEERQTWMRLLARVIGFRAAIIFHSTVKRVVKGRDLP